MVTTCKMCEGNAKGYGTSVRIVGILLKPLCSDCKKKCHTEPDRVIAYYPHLFNCNQPVSTNRLVKEPSIPKPTAHPIFGQQSQTTPEMTTMHCQNCGAPLMPGDRFCVNCSAATAANSSVGNVPYPSARKSNRMPITVLVVLLIAGGIIAAFLLTNSLKSQLVGTWSTDTMGKSLGIQGSRPIPTAETWKFFSDNTGRMEHFTSSGSFKYTILDDGRIKIEFQGGQKAEGKLDRGDLILAAFGEKPVVLYKW